jgi:hypothetical protein
MYLKRQAMNNTLTSTRAIDATPCCDGIDA